MDKEKNKQLGFSIIEVVAALGVLTIGLVGVTSLAVQNISGQYINRNNIIASQLAQEGLELIRNKRDTNWLGKDDGLDWKLGAGPGSSGDIIMDNIYTINYDETTSSSSDSIDSTSARLYINSNGFYDHDSSGRESNFWRVIEISSSTVNSVDVKVVVRWRERGRSHDYIARTSLYNWR